MAGGRWRVHGCCRGVSCFIIQIALLLASARAQVRNLRFVDEDSTSGKIGGHIYWDIPAAGDQGIDYAAYLATDATGATKTQLPLGNAHDLPGGAAVSSFPVPMDTAYGSNTHIVVYEKAHGTGALSNIAFICIIDNPDGFVRTVYATMTGYTKATDARSALVTGCHVSYESVKLEMVATAKWDGSQVIETQFDDSDEYSSTASFMLTFPTGTSFTDISTALTSYVDDAPLPAVYTGTGSDTAYSLGVIQAASILDDFVPNRPDPDIAVYIARSCIHYNVAGAVIVGRDGYIRIQTKADKQTAVNEMANVFLNTNAVSYSDMGAVPGTLTAIAAGSTVASAVCYQITGGDSTIQPSCLSPYAA